MKQKKCLFISPHPDDTELGCGGTISRKVYAKEEIHIAIVCGLGDLNMVHNGLTVSWSQRMKEQEEVAIHCGARLHWFDIAPASRLDEQPLVKLISQLGRLLAMEDFDEVYAPMPSHSQDHMYVFNAVQAAFRPGKAKANLFLYEQPTNFHGPQVGAQYGSYYYVRLDTMNMWDKCALIGFHKSQMKGREGGIDGLAGVKALARLRGLECGAEDAERFIPMRVIV